MSVAAVVIAVVVATVALPSGYAGWRSARRRMAPLREARARGLPAPERRAMALDILYRQHLRSLWVMTLGAVAIGVQQAFTSLLPRWLLVLLGVVLVYQLGYVVLLLVMRRRSRGVVHP